MRETRTRSISWLTRKVARRLSAKWSLRAQEILLVSASCLVLVLGIGLFSRYAVSPAEGIIAAVSHSFRAAPASLDMTPRLLSDSYASFRYPRGLRVMTTQPVRAPVLGVYSWRHEDIQTWRLAVSIIDVPTYKITDNNAYLLRKLNPRRYSESLKVINGQVVPIMTDTTAEGFSEVGFLRSGRYQAIVSLYGDDEHGDQQLQATLAMVLGSWHWRYP